jgi:hypothetical protein
VTNKTEKVEAKVAAKHDIKNIMKHEIPKIQVKHENKIAPKNISQNSLS